MYSQELLSGMAPRDIQRILAVEHSDPHAVLGAHPGYIQGKHGIIVRALHPDAIKAELVIDGERIPMQTYKAAGLFSYFLPGREFPLNHRICFYFQDGTTWEADTPYRFAPTLGEQDLHFIGQGKHYELYDKLGAHPREIEQAHHVSMCFRPMRR